MHNSGVDIKPCDFKPLMATYMGFVESEPLNCSNSSVVNGSSLGGAKSALGACMMLFKGFSNISGEFEVCA